MGSWANYAALGASLAVTACGVEDATAPDTAPVIYAIDAASNPRNALSVLVTVRVDLADSLTVRVTPSVFGEAPPAVRPEGGEAVVPVLGLFPQTSYTLVVVAYRGGALVEANPVEIETPPLPSDLPTYSTSGSAPSSGYVVFAAGKYGIAIDNTGRVVWYHGFSPAPGLNFQPQPNGRYAARPPPSDPSTLAPWVEIDPLGNVVRTLACARGLQPRFHDLIANPSGDYWILCDETRTMDLSSEGGSTTARVTGTVIQHIGLEGDLLFEWNPFDHFAITDLELASRRGPTVNWTHGNALDLDDDGNLVVSFRSLSEITKIDSSTGSVMWRMGGLRNQFTFLNAGATPFARQHGVRLTGHGRLVLLDNSGDALASRAERYVYNAEVDEARLVASYGPQPAVIAQLGGTTQDLPGGHTLVAFGDGGRVQEYDAAGEVVWQIEGNAGYIFRAHRIESLYHPGVEGR